jgi:hypothetical protein
MKKNVLVFGSIAGLIVALCMVISMAIYYKNPSLEGNMWIGYGSMIVAFSLIFVAIKNFRDKYNNGAISFGKAFRIGLYIALIGSSFYVLAWLIEYYIFMPDFMDKYVAHAIAKAKASGASQAEMARQKEQMAGYASMYKSPLGVIAFTYAEILPVGLVIALIAALILKRKPGTGQTIQVV